MELIYGFDPLCGWCYGAIPAIRAVREALPDLAVRPVMAGLVTGPRVGPYADALGYIRSAAEHMRQRTGRYPAHPFWDLIATPGVMGDSAPPCVAIHAVERAAPGAALDFAHAVVVAHFERGADLNLAESYAPMIARHAPGVTLPDLHDPDLAMAAMAEGRALGVSSFPTLVLRAGGVERPVRPIYDPPALARLVAEQALALRSPSRGAVG